MRLQELGYTIRKARLGLGLTQAKLASGAGLSRTTLNLLENGLFPDLGIRKVKAILDQLGLTLLVQPATRVNDFVRMACTTANVSYKSSLTEDELLRALLNGKVPAGKRPHLRTLLDEAPAALLRGLVKQVSEWTRPGRVEKNLALIADEVSSSRKLGAWLKTN
jgi:transcriptional regulator with XRE-family HTH domain